MGNWDDLKSYEESAAYNHDYAERLEQRRQEMRSHGESTKSIDEDIRRARRNAAKAEEVAAKLRTHMGLGSPSHPDSTSTAAKGRRETDEMEEAMRDIRRARSQKDY